MTDKKVSQLDAAASLSGGELVMVSQLSTTVTMTRTDISALASDNSINTVAGDFVAAGFTVGSSINIAGFTGSLANNILSAVITAVTAAKLTIGGTDGDVIADDAAGESVTVTQWVSRRTTVSALSGSAANVTADTHPSSPAAANDEFEYGTVIDTAGSRSGGAVAWSWVNQGAATAAVSNGSLVLTQGAQSTSDNLRCVMQSVSGSTWKYRAKVTLFGQRATSNGATAGIIFAGIAVRNSSSEKMLTAHMLSNCADAAPGRVEANRWTSATAYSATYSATTDVFRGANYNLRAAVTLYFEVEQTATQIIFSWSDTGIPGTYKPLTAEPLATFITSVDQVGIFHANTLNATHTPPTATIVDWWRKVA